MYHAVVLAGKGLFVVGAGTALAVANGGIHEGVTVGQLLAGGGGVILGLSILKAASEIGRLRQMVYGHEGRITRLENSEDAKR